MVEGNEFEAVEAPVEPVSKYPELEAIRDRLQAEKDEILDRSADLRAERDELRDQLAQAEVRLRELNHAIIEIERPRMGEIDNQLGGLAKAMGGRSLANPG